MNFLKAKRWEIMLFVAVIHSCWVYTSTDLITKVYGFFLLFLIFRHVTSHCYENGSHKTIICAATLNTVLLTTFCSWKIALYFIAAFIWGWVTGARNISLKSEVKNNV